LRPFYLLCFKIFGWKVNGKLPDLNKYIFAVAPHTSNWDFVVGIAARSILRVRRAKFLGKSPLFKKPYGWIFRSIGGIPVYRDKSHDLVEQVVAIARKSEDFLLAIAPEGTRKKVSKLKTGFWYIAKAVNIPIVPVGFDFKRKEIVVGPVVYPTELEKDMNRLMEFYKGIHGKNPELGL
jgi:1-acyl-sn-glycerol-3-phosphate acyltransferase